MPSKMAQQQLSRRIHYRTRSQQEHDRISGVLDGYLGQVGCRRVLQQLRIYHPHPLRIYQACSLATTITHISTETPQTIHQKAATTHKPDHSKSKVFPNPVSVECVLTFDELLQVLLILLEAFPIFCTSHYAFLFRRNETIDQENSLQL